MKRAISIIQEDGTTEIQWGRREPGDGIIDGYLLIHTSGAITIPFRGPDETPYLFTLNSLGASVSISEDTEPGFATEVLWSMIREERAT